MVYRPIDMVYRITLFPCAQHARVGTIKNPRGARLHRAGSFGIFYFRLCHRKRLIYAKIFFCGLTRKIQERQAFCERAYLESMKTSKTRSISQNFSVKNQPRDGTEPYFNFKPSEKAFPTLSPRV